MATTVIMNPPSELAGENSFRENRDPRGWQGSHKPENIELMEEGSDHAERETRGWLRPGKRLISSCLNTKLKCRTLFSWHSLVGVNV